MPLSAIDWLSDSVGDQALPNIVPQEQPTSLSGNSPQVTVMPLDVPSADYVGVLGPQVTGFSPDLWTGSKTSDVVEAIQSQIAPSTPAIQDLLITILLAETKPPFDADQFGRLFFARVDKLLDLGALAEAEALLMAADIQSPQIFRRWFDVALLTGREDAPCALMQQRPTMAPTHAARIFCLARSGSWDVAALTLNTHRVLGDISPEEEDLLTRFLDPALAEELPAIAKPDRLTPLIFRIREAIGEGLATFDKPLAFAHADLRDTTGWKAQLEAAERLTRAGALDANVLQQLYNSKTPSASGGIWNRAKAVQRLDRAINARDTAEVSDALAHAWTEMTQARLEVPFAILHAHPISDMSVTKEAMEIKARLLLLAEPDYGNTASLVGAPNIWLSIANGLPLRPNDTNEHAIAAAFNNVTSSPLIDLANEGQSGLALLRAIEVFESGLDGDWTGVTEALELFIHLGLDNVARRAALQALILERAP